MTTTEVTPNSRPLINFAPGNVVDEVLQNVATLLSTIRYTVPYDRELGITPDYLDDPTPLTRARLTADVIDLLRRREPRAKVIEVTFDEDQGEGYLIPKVKVTVDG